MQKISRILLCSLLLLSTNTIMAAEVTIAVAANFTSTMQQLVSRFEAQHEHSVRVVYGSSGLIYAQIINGAPFDIFFSADQEKPLALESDNLIVDGSRFTYALGSIALWSKTPGLALENDEILTQLNFNKLAMANPRLAPYGVAALETLQNLGLEEATRPFWVQGENIAQAFQFTDSRNADLGFVALSQILENGELREGSAWIIPENLYTPIKQDAVLLKRAEQNQAAHDFLNFIRSDDALTLIGSFGYRLTPE